MQFSWYRLAAVAGLVLAAVPGHAARVASVSPQGEVGEVRQVTVRFDAAVVPAGDPRLPPPFTLTCSTAQPPTADARWDGPATWVLDLRQPLPAGVRCTLKPVAGFRTVSGAALEDARDFGFSTGAPVVLQVQPYPGARIEEDQHFLLRLNGSVTPAVAQRAAWCEAEGTADRIGVRVVEGAARQAVLRERGRVPAAEAGDAAPWLLLACQRSFAPEARVRLVWGLPKNPQRWQWQVRPRLLAEFGCEREKASQPCLPLRPMTLRFNAPVAKSVALAARLVPDKGEPIAPRADAGGDETATVTSLRFAAPLPENTRFRLVLPPGLADDAGRPLANAGAFPLAVATGGLPPLAKFAGAPFGIVEAGPQAMMPLTLRHVQADIAGASTAGQVVVKRFDAATADAELLRWLSRLRQADDDQFRTRDSSLLAAEANVQRAALPQLIGTREPAATEVIGIPLPQRGYHVIEVGSRILGHALLAEKKSMYARTGALVTNLAVHFKRGLSSSLVWVTSLDRGRPVAGARVAVSDCRGTLLFSGISAADGTLRIARAFDAAAEQGAGCGSNSDGLFVSARQGDDVSFVFSQWQRGIEPWRFDIPLGQAEHDADAAADAEALRRDGAPVSRRAHTVFDRTLLRAGETVAMKHFVRDETEAGLALPAVGTLPTEVLLRHVGSEAETLLPLAWPRGARAAESRWAIPANAALGSYDVSLQRGNRRLASGSLRVEAFRVPLIDARLAAPAGVQLAPRELAFSAQLNALAGGPMAGVPLQLSATLRRKSVQFAGHDGFSFEPPGSRGEDNASGDSDADSSARLVADKLAATTDRQGAARIVAGNLPALAGPSELQAELRFADPNGEVQTVSQRVALWPAGVVVGLRVPGWAAVNTGSGAEAGATAVLLSTDGKPLAGRAVEIIGRARQTLTTRKRIVGGFYAYDNQRQVRELGTLCKGSTDAQGRLACTLQLQASGEIELVARARDDAGRVAEAASSLWASGQSEWWFEQGNDDRIDVLPEQHAVQPGQVARLQVRMPFRQATALVTVEREGVVDSRVVQLSGKQPVIELPIPQAAAGAASWAPNVVVSVLVQRGRLREAPWWSAFTWGWREPAEWWRAFRYENKDWRAPTALVDMAKPAFKLGVAQLVIGTAEHRLDVAVKADKAQYGVRETAQATVRVSQRGKPVANAEVAFAAVDEGLLALQDNASWNLLEGLLQPRPWGVATATALNEVVGRRHYGRKALPPGGGGGRNPTRELFDTLLLWRGSVQLDANGEARIAVPLNDSLTSFRLVAVADAGADRFGHGSTRIRVSQDLQLLPGLPPLVRAGDRFEAGITLRNTTARSVTLQATLRGAAVVAGSGAANGAVGSTASGAVGSTASGAVGGTAGGAGGAAAIATPPQAVTLAAGEAREVRWPVAVPPGATRIDWLAEAAETGASGKPLKDSVKVAQGVVPAVDERVLQSQLQQLATAASYPLAPASGALPGTARVQATLTPRLAGGLPGVRRYFETYPYSCLEQKTSRAIGLRDSAGFGALQGEIAGYIDSDGLAGYFPPQPGSAPAGSDRLTAYLLSAVHEAGWQWPQAQADALLQGLVAFVEGRIERRWPSPRPDLDVRKLAALEALARHGRVQPRMLGSLAWQPVSWPTSALLDAWSLYQRADHLPDRTARLDEVQRLIRSRLAAGGTALRFSTEAQDDWWWLMDGPDANAARLLLLATASPAWQEELPLILSGTLARQRGGAWLTTTANLWGALALERFGARFESTAVAGRSTLQLAGASRALDWAGAASGASFSLPLAAAGSLTAAHQGSGRPWLTLQSLAAVPLEAPLFAGFRVARSVTPLQRKDPAAWSRGDLARVRLEVEATADMGIVVLSDPLPAGAVVLGGGLGRDSAIAVQGQQQLGAAPAWQERTPQAFRSYWRWLPRGRHTLEYTLRLNTAGRFALPPTRVEAMYAPESFGELPNAVIEVRP